MFEERYRKLYQDVTPSEELSQETVELMIEARNHRAKPLPEKKSKLPMIIWLSAAGTVAAAFIVLVSVLAILNRGTDIDEVLGTIDLTTKVEEDTETNDPSADAPAPEDPSKPTDQPKEPAPEIAILPSDRFTSFKAYFKALDEKTTIGYGKNYFLCKEMVVYPAKLPEGAKLIEVLQYEDGQYEYSYRLTREDGNYVLTIRSQSTFPTSEEAMKAQLELIDKEEEPTFISEGNTRTYRFGKLDAIIVTLSREAIVEETPAPESETPKVETPEGETPEGETPESETPEGETPEGETPESGTPESETPKNETTVTEPAEPVAAEEPVKGEIAADDPAANEAPADGSEAQSTEPDDPDASVSSPVQPAPLTQEEVDALLKDFALIRYLKK